MFGYSMHQAQSIMIKGMRIVGVVYETSHERERAREQARKKKHIKRKSTKLYNILPVVDVTDVVVVVVLVTEVVVTVVVVMEVVVVVTIDGERMGVG